MAVKDNYDGTIVLNPPQFEPDPVPVIFVKSVLTILTVLGNLWVILAVATTKNLRRIPNNIFICSLAVADFLIGAFVMPLDMLAWVTRVKCFANSDEGGHALFLLQYVLIVSSIWNLSVISYDRYLFVSDNVKYTSWMVGYKVFLFLNIGWLIPICHLMLTVIFAKFTPDAMQMFQSITMAIVIVCPLTIILLSYIRIVYIAKKSTGDPASTENTGNTQKKTNIIIGMLVCLAFVLLLPYYIYYAYTLIIGIKDCRVIEILFWVVYTNSTVNPFIYTVFNNDYRRAMFRLFICMSGKQAEASTSPGKTPKDEEEKQENEEIRDYNSDNDSHFESSTYSDHT